MASNLKKAPEKAPAAEGGKPARAAVPFDLKWLFAIVGFVGLTAGSVVLGLSLAPMRTITREVAVDIPKPDPGPSFPLVADQVANLKGGGFLRYSLVVQFEKNEELFPAAGGKEGGKTSPLADYEAALRDATLSAVGELTRAQAADVAQKQRFKETLKQALNAAIGWNIGADGQVRDRNGKPVPSTALADIKLPRVHQVYFTNWVAQ